MTRLRLWWAAADKNQVFYFAGLGMLFAGLSLGVSVATAMIVTGAVLVVIGAANAFFVTWLSSKGE